MSNEENSNLTSVGDIPSLLTDRDQYLMAGCDDGRIRVWKCVQNDPIHFEYYMDYEIHSDSINCLCVLADQARLATASSDRAIKIWNFNDFQNSVQTLEGHSSNVNTLCYFSNLECLISGSSDGTIIAWQRGNLLNSHRFELKYRLDNAHLRSVNDLIKLENNQLASCSDDFSIKIWQLNDKNNITYITELQREEMRHTRNVKCLAFFPGTNQIISGSEDRAITIWDSANGNFSFARYNMHRVFSLLRIENNRFASGSADNRIRIWSMNPSITDNPLKIFDGHSNYVLCMTNINNETLASGSQDKTIKIWKLNLDDPNPLIQTLSVEDPRPAVVNSLALYKN